MSLKAHKIIVLFLLAGILVAYNNCGSPFGTPSALQFQDSRYVANGPAASYDAFERTVYPLTRANCISCHTTQAPVHAHESVYQAHDSLIEGFKVNFLDPASSRLVKKLRDEQHNCWGDCAANANEMQAAIEDWALSLDEVPAPATPEAAPEIETPPTRSMAEELADPANKNRDKITLSFDLSPYLGFGDVYLAIDIEDYDEYSYKFSRPRIETSSREKIHVKNIKILINGNYNPQHALFTVIDKITEQGDRVLSDAALIAIKDKGTDIDEISISFEKLRLVNQENQSYVAFESSVWQVTRANCTSCHSVTEETQHASPDSALAHDAVLNRSLVNFTNVPSSPLVRRLRVERHNCGTNLECDDLAAQMQAAIEEWQQKR